MNGDPMIATNLRASLNTPGLERWLHVMGNALQIVMGYIEVGQLAQCPEAQTAIAQQVQRLRLVNFEMRQAHKAGGALTQLTNEG